MIKIQKFLNFKELRMEKFSNTEKINSFNILSEKFYLGNFGNFSKTEFDLLMFHFFYENYKKNSKKKYISDYEISKELGITQSRVKNLRIKCELMYPDQNFDWKQEFKNKVSDARFNHLTEKVSIPIFDPIILLEVQNYVEEIDLYNEVKVTSKVLETNIFSFLDLIISFEEEDYQNELRGLISSEIEQKNKNEGKKFEHISSEEKISNVFFKNNIEVMTIVRKLSKNDGSEEKSLSNFFNTYFDKL